MCHTDPTYRPTYSRKHDLDRALVRGLSVLTYVDDLDDELWI